jgi:hypothetical protein
MLVQKEQELNKVMIEYYNFDMTELKKDIERILNTESDKIS